MKPYERIISIIMLLVISMSNVATPVAYAVDLGRIHLKFPASYPQVTASDKPTAFAVDTGSVLGASTSLMTVGAEDLDLRDGNNGSAQQRIPIHMQTLPKKVYDTTEDVSFDVVNPDNEAFITSVTDVNGKEVAVPVSERNDGTTTTVDLASSNQLKPGKYTVTVKDQEGQSTSQNFSWGVLALNTDKSLYHPQDTADIAMAVLNDNGDMVCDANIDLRIQNSGLGIDDTLSTDASSSADKITVNPQCQQHDYSLQPDYEAHYQFGGAGTYSLTLTATTESGTHTITDSIGVTGQIPFDVQRVSATRIYPPNTYPMTFNITANRDFSGTVTETVPDSFTITPATQSAAQSYNDMTTMYLNSNDPVAAMSQQIASQSGGLVMPFHGNYPITQGFGAQLTDPTLQAFYTQYGLAGHDGIDFGLPMDTPLYAVDDGIVIWSGPGDYGTMVTILHSWGQTYYGHMSTTSVTVGEHVDKGQLIGYSGMSGEATGPHLHFGMKPKNSDMTNGYYGKIDPMPFLPIGQGESISALGPAVNPVSNPIASLVNSTTVLGSSTSASVSPTATSGSESPTPQPSVSPTQIPSPTPTVAPSVSPTPGVSPEPTQSPTPSVDLGSSSPSTSSGSTTNTNFSVLDQQIKTSEMLANSAQTEKVKIITWHVNLKKGESTSLGYAYQAPNISPQFYLLGPAKFYDSHTNNLVFQEQRQWQIASDDVGVEWYQNTGGPHNWNGYSWQYRKKIDIDHTKVGLPAVDATSTATEVESGPSNATSISWSHTTGTQSNRLLIVTVQTAQASGSAAGLVTGITYNTTTILQKAAQIRGRCNSTANQCDAEIWYAVNPPSGTYTIAVSTAANRDIDGAAMTFYNVDQSNPLGTAATIAQQITGTHSVTVNNTNTNQYVVDSIADDSVIAVNAAQTKVLNNCGCDIISEGMSYREAASTSTTMSWTDDGGGQNYYAQAAVPINAAQANFPVLVSLSGDPDLSAHAQTNCNDVVFTDSTGRNLLNYELEDGTTDCSSGNLNAWVKIPSLSSATDTIIYMYFGNPSATSLANASGVWDSNYQGVYHMSNSAANHTVSDSTSNARTGSSDRNTSLLTSTGEIYKALTLSSADDDNIQINSLSSSLQTGSVTFSFWFTPTTSITSSINATQVLASLDDTSAKNTVSVEVGADCSAGTICLNVDSGSGNKEAQTSQNSWTAGTWYYITGVFSTTNGMTMYINGAVDGTNTNITRGSTPYSTHFWVGGSESINDYCDCAIDELQISNTDRSSGWIATEYTNQNAPESFYSLGKVETDIDAPQLSQLMRHGEWFDSTGTVQPFTF